jgi:hypothetical protein
VVALVSEIFVESVQYAALEFGMTPAFVGCIVVAIVGAATEMMAAFRAARKNRLDMSIGIAVGSSTQIALFVARVLVLLSLFIAPALGLVHGRTAAGPLCDHRDDPVPDAARGDGLIAAARLECPAGGPSLASVLDRWTITTGIRKGKVT